MKLNMTECFKRCLLSFQEEKEGEREREKPSKEKKVKMQYLTTKVWSPAETPEQRENKQQQKKRKVQDKQQKSVSVSTVH